MPDPNVPLTPLQSQQGNWMADAPGGDLDLDSLFPNPELVPQTPTQAPAVVPQAPPAPEWYLDSDTGTKYRTREEAARGLAEKDRYITKLRQELEATKPTQPQTPQAPAGYSQNPDKLFDDLVASAQKGDKRAYAETLGAYQREQIANVLGPYADLLGEVSREQAIRQAESETHGVRDFVGSPDFTAYLESRPILKQAIEFSMSNPQAASQGKELLQIAFEASQGRKVPEIARTVAAQSAAPPQPIRPTLGTSTPTPPAGVFTNQVQPNLYSREGRKAILERGQSRGLQDMDWTKAGL
jgi:hypothetical protein